MIIMKFVIAEKLHEKYLEENRIIWQPEAARAVAATISLPYYIFCKVFIRNFFYKKRLGTSQVFDALTWNKKVLYLNFKKTLNQIIRFKVY